MESSEWRKGAVKRLTSIYEAITKTTTRNSEFINEVSRALKEGAVAVKQPRPQTPPRTWSKKAHFGTSAEEVQRTKPMTSPVPAPSLRSPKVRSEPSKPSVPASERLGRCEPSLVQPTPELACAFPSEKPRSPLRSAPNATVLPPTPPESPVGELNDYDFTPGFSSEAQSIPQSFNPTLAAEPPRAKEVARPPFPRNCSVPHVGLPYHISSLRGSGHKPSLEQSAKGPKATPPPVQNPLEMVQAVPEARISIPKIRLRNVDDKSTPSREVSLSSTLSAEPEFSLPKMSDASSVPIATTQRGLSKTDQNESPGDLAADHTAIEAYLMPLRVKALQGLEEDTSTLVDALRSFVNSMREMAQELDMVNPRTEACEGDFPYRSSISREVQATSLCTAVKTQLQHLRAHINSLKLSREKMLQLADQGPSALMNQTLDISDWTKLSRTRKIQRLYHLHDIAVLDIRQHTDEALIALLAETGNVEFLGKVTGWEKSVRALEEDFGGLFG